MPLQPGSRFGAYRIDSLLGIGGMGEVYRAHDAKLQRHVALKVLPDALAGDPDRVARLTREAQTLASINHPNIAHVYGVEESDDRLALVMELVEGRTLEELLATHPGGLPWPEVAALGSTMAETVAGIDERGLVHRDLKPANIKITPDGRVKILDFGLARLVRHEPPIADAQRDTQLDPHTRPGMLVGTIRYMSPEQASGAEVDARSDIWSLGVILFELLTGRAPFPGESTAQQLVAILDREPAGLGDLGTQLPAGFTRILQRALAKGPADRYQSARELAADLDRLGRGDVRAPAAMSRQARRSTVWVMAAAVVAIAAVAAAVMMSGRPTPPAAPAAGAAIESIAVLPFENTSPSPDDQYLSDGISESLINSLSNVPKISVVSRNTAFRFRGKDVVPTAVGQQLGVGAVLSGTVRRVSGQLVIGVALVDVGRDVQLWGDQYVRPAGDVIAIQSEIARAVALQLRERLAHDVEARVVQHLTENVAAYDAYLQGRFFESKADPASCVKATVHYERAVASDPAFAEAWVGLGRTWLLRGIHYEAPRETMTRALRNADQALALNPAHAEAHVVRGLVALLYDWDWAEARRELVVSDGLVRSAVNTFSCAAHLMQGAGRAADAEREIRRALAADPLSVTANTELGCNSFYLQQDDHAIADYRRALELDASNPVALWGLGRAYAAKGDYPAALAELRRVEALHGGSPPVVTGEIGYVLGKSGDRAAARTLAQLDADAKTMFVDPYFRAIVYLGMKQSDDALHWLEEARTVRSSFLPSLPDDWRWDALRQHPRLMAVQAELKIDKP